MKRRRPKIGIILKRLWKAVDLDERDIFLFLGIIALAIGLYGIDWRLSAATIGGLLIYMGLFHKWRRETD